MRESRVCETCGQLGEVVVYSLPGVPMSVGNCKRCARRNAYPLSTVLAIIEVNKGLENCAAWVHEIVTYKDGRYIGAEDLQEVR